MPLSRYLVTIIIVILFIIYSPYLFTYPYESRFTNERDHSYTTPVFLHEDDPDIAELE